MSLLALALVLAAACSHAAWNFLIKRINGGPELIWLVSVLSSLLYLPLALWILIVDKPALGWTGIGFCLGSAGLHLAYFLLLQRGYRHGDLSLVYPTARATGPLLSTGLAVVLLGENLTAQVLTGGLAIIAGVVFLTGGFGRRAHHVTTSLLFGLGVGLLISVYTIWDAYTVRTLLVPPLLLDYTSGLVRMTLLAPYGMTRRERVAAHWRDHRLAVIGVSVFNPLAYILVLIALTFTPVVYVAPARETSVLITVALGAVLLGEGELRKRMSWACLILLGMTLLATG